jgi:hypothetical protein
VSSLKLSFDASLFKQNQDSKVVESGSLELDAQLSSKSCPNLTHLNCSTRTRFGPITLNRGAVY